jgi:hypothetical protein
VYCRQGGLPGDGRCDSLLSAGTHSLKPRPDDRLVSLFDEQARCGEQVFNRRNDLLVTGFVREIYRDGQRFGHSRDLMFVFWQGGGKDDCPADEVDVVRLDLR